MPGPLTPEPHVVCPRCSYQLPLTDTLAAPLLEAARKELSRNLGPVMGPGHEAPRGRYQIQSARDHAALSETEKRKRA
jgi:hypothetical protein